MTSFQARSFYAAHSSRAYRLSFVAHSSRVPVRVSCMMHDRQACALCRLSKIATAIAWWRACQCAHASTRSRANRLLFCRNFLSCISLDSPFQAFAKILDRPFQGISPKSVHDFFAFREFWPRVTYTYNSSVPRTWVHGKRTTATAFMVSASVCLHWWPVVAVMVSVVCLGGLLLRLLCVMVSTASVCLLF